MKRPGCTPKTYPYPNPKSRFHTLYLNCRSTAFLSGLFRVLSGTTDGCTARHVLLFCTIKMFRGWNFRVNGQGTSLHALASTVPSVRVASSAIFFYVCGPRQDEDQSRVFLVCLLQNQDFRYSRKGGKTFIL